jgi:hypothetical protein
MRRVELFEAWVGEKRKSNTLAESIISELDKWGVNWVNVTSKTRRGHGGVAMMIPYDEIIKFFASGYFSDDIFASLPPARRDVIEAARLIKNPTRVTLRSRWSGDSYTGPTFVIMASGRIRQWLNDFKKVSSNDNIDINPGSEIGVKTGTRQFFSFLAYNIEHIVFRQFIEQSTLADLNSLSNSQLKKSNLVDAIISKYREQELDNNGTELFDRIIKLNRSNDSTLYRIVTSIKLTDMQYLAIFNILDRYDSDIDIDNLWGSLVKAKAAPRKLRLEALIRIERVAELISAFKEFNDITSKELMDIYFDDRASDAARRLAKDNPNFGDVVGDEGGILSDW